MTDRELLELAAKASGIVLADEVDSYIPASRAMWVVGPGGRDALWNPLNDDGDALRLAVRLSMDVMGEGTMENGTPCRSVVFPINGDFDGLSEMEGDDPLAATRRAIVRAAAEIGKATNG